MSQWIPVIGTLLGAIVAGAISLLIVRQSNAHAIRQLDLQLAEERTRWATEKKLESLKDFYSSVESLLDATGQFRVQQAWDASKDEDGFETPDWVASYDKARGEFEDTLHRVYLQACLLDKEIEAEFDVVRKGEMNWFRAKSKEDSVQALLSMERDLTKFRGEISKRFRKIFEDREKGRDVAIV